MCPSVVICTRFTRREARSSLFLGAVLSVLPPQLGAEILQQLVTADDVAGTPQEELRDVPVAQIDRRQPDGEPVAGVVDPHLVGDRLESPLARLDSRPQPVAGIPGVIHSSSLRRSASRATL